MNPVDHHLNIGAAVTLLIAVVMAAIGAPRSTATARRADPEVLGAESVGSVVHRPGPTGRLASGETVRAPPVGETRICQDCGVSSWLQSGGTARVGSDELELLQGVLRVHVGPASGPFRVVVGSAQLALAPGTYVARDVAGHPTALAVIAGSASGETDRLWEIDVHRGRTLLLDGASLLEVRDTPAAPDGTWAAFADEVARSADERREAASERILPDPLEHAAPQSPAVVASKALLQPPAPRNSYGYRADF